MSDLYVSPRLTIASAFLQWSASRSSGPGGQNVNKVSTKVTLKFDLARCEAIDAVWRHRIEARHANRINAEGELVIQSDIHREQPRNLADARSRLARLLAECQAAPKKRLPSKPSLGAQRRRIETKHRTGEKKKLRRGSFEKDD
jgi:ribosome-associated protein